MTAASRPAERLGVRLLRWADWVCDRLYSQASNPLYQSGTIVVVLYLVLLVTGLWLILFYRVGSPWESVARVTADPWKGGSSSSSRRVTGRSARCSRCPWSP